MGKHVVAIIPARGGSKGIPRKNLINFAGKPLIAWSIEQALAADGVNEVFVSTDDQEIAEVSQQYGAKIIQRPAEFATDKASSEQALTHAITELEKERRIDCVVFLQATSPVRHAQDIAGAISQLEKDEADSLFSATQCDDFCLWKRHPTQGYDSYTFDYRNRGRRQDREPLFLENGSIYVFKPEVLKTHGNRLGGKISVFLMPMKKSFEIDSIEDVEFVESLMKMCLS